MLLTCSHWAQDLINSFFLFVEEDSPTQTDNEVSVLFQESVLVRLDQVVEGRKTVGYPGDPLNLQFVSLQGCAAAHLKNRSLTSQLNFTNKARHEWMVIAGNKLLFYY